MKAVGIIAEYNPFHNGHAYQIEQARRLSGADTVIVLMSGDFVQRGEPAIIDKYTRARMALLSGADLVFELPVCIATASAEQFAAGAVAILNGLGIGCALCFGSESGELTPLAQTAKLLVQEPSYYRRPLQLALKSGMPFPAARSYAVAEAAPALSPWLREPNNILGIEYLKATQRFAPAMEVYTVKRQGSPYHDTKLPEQAPTVFPSASAIRSELFRSVNRNTANLEQGLPFCCKELLSAVLSKYAPVGPDCLSDILHYALHFGHEPLDSYLDVSPEIASRIEKQLHQSFSFTELAGLVRTKYYTASRIRRALLHIILNIKPQDLPPACLPSCSSANESVSGLYARLLGLRTGKAAVLRGRSQQALPIISKIADASSQLDTPAFSRLTLDIAASDLYHQLIYEQSGHKIESDYFHPLCIIR